MPTNRRQQYNSELENSTTQAYYHDIYIKNVQNRHRSNSW